MLELILPDMIVPRHLRRFHSGLEARRGRMVSRPRGLVCPRCRRPIRTPERAPGRRPAAPLRWRSLTPPTLAMGSVGDRLVDADGNWLINSDGLREIAQMADDCGCCCPATTCPEPNDAFKLGCTCNVRGGVVVKPRTITVTISVSAGACRPFCNFAPQVWGKVASFDGTFVLTSYADVGADTGQRCGWQWDQSVAGPGAAFPVTTYTDAGCTTPGGAVTVAVSSAHVDVTFFPPSGRFIATVSRGDSVAAGGCPDGTARGGFGDSVGFNISDSEAWDCCATRTFALDTGGTLTIEGCS